MRRDHLVYNGTIDPCPQYLMEGSLVRLVERPFRVMKSVQYRGSSAMLLYLLGMNLTDTGVPAEMSPQSTAF
jgi:hypothetical protein